MVDHSLQVVPEKVLKKLDPDMVLDSVFPKVEVAIEECGGKSQTFYMDRNMTIGERPTILGKARQVMQEISATRDAIRSNYFSVQIELEELKEVEKQVGPDHILMKKKNSDLAASQVYYRGAVKRLVNFCKIYEELCKELGVDRITEEMIDANQPKEHVMTMFLQAYRSACENGVPTEGDFIYSDQVNVDPSQCVYEVRQFLFDWKGKMKVKTKKEKMDWLERMYLKYALKN